MDYEKKYSDALNRARKYHGGGNGNIVCIEDMLEEIFLELRESEDDKIRKELWNYFHDLQLRSDADFSPSFTIDDILTYLEKQKEQPTNKEMLITLWTEYEKGRADAIAEFANCNKRRIWYQEGLKAGIRKTINEAKDAANRFAPNPNSLSPFEHTFRGYILSAINTSLQGEYGEGWQQFIKEWSNDLLTLVKKDKQSEWSEEDRRILDEAIAMIESRGCWVRSDDAVKQVSDFLKSLRPQLQSPSLSDKEILCLKRALDYLRKEHGRYAGEDFTNEIAVLEWLITHPVMVYTPQPHWKPSEEQMEALGYAIQIMSTDLSVKAAKASQELESIREQLKSL